MKPVPLGNALLELRTGPFGSLLHKADYVTGGIPLVNPMHIADGRVCVDQEYSVTAKKADQLSVYMLKPGDLVMGRRGEIGRCAVISQSDGDLLCGTGSMILVPDPNIIDSYYLAHLIRTPRARKFLESEASGATMLNLNPSAAAKLPVPIPPLDEQKRIAAILDKADQLRRKRQRALDRLNQLGQAIFNEMFGNLENRQTPLRKLGDLTSKIGSGATPKGGDAAYKDDGIPLIRSMNVRDGEFSYKGLAFLDDGQASKLNNVIVKSNDVLLNITGASVARVCRAPSSMNGARVNQHVSIIRLNDNLSSEFLEAFLLMPNTKRKLLNIAESGATRQAITKTQIEELVVPVPDQARQAEFASNLNATKEVFRAGEIQFEHFDDLFLSLQYRAFRGEL